jgi:hypothetical protein
MHARAHGQERRGRRSSLARRLSRCPSLSRCCEASRLALCQRTAPLHGTAAPTDARRRRYRSRKPDRLDAARAPPAAQTPTRSDRIVPHPAPGALALSACRRLSAAAASCLCCCHSRLPATAALVPMLRAAMLPLQYTASAAPSNCPGAATQVLRRWCALGTLAPRPSSCGCPGAVLLACFSPRSCCSLCVTKDQSKSLNAADPHPRARPQHVSPHRGLLRSSLSADGCCAAAPDVSTRTCSAAQR